MSVADDAIVLSLHGAVAVLRLNEPKSMNALSGRIKAAFERLVPKLLDDDNVRVLLITGTGKAFCAGGDIRNMGERRPVKVHARMQRTQHWAGRLLLSGKPVVTAVNGAAAGAGLSLAMMGDIILASSEARFKGGFPALGAVPDLGLLYSLPRAIGMPRAKDMLLCNRELSAEEAAAMGLVSRLVGGDRLFDEALAVATGLASGPPVSLGLTKSLLRRTYESGLEAFLESEAVAQAIAFSTEDFGEGVDAFLAKRKATFTGN